MHVMIDIETMGTRPNAPIISIGAVAFDADGITSEFYANVSLGSAVRSGAAIDPNTVMWWMRQNKSAQDAFNDAQAQTVRLGDALVNMDLWIDWSTVKGVWGNGATFDNVIMRESYTRLEITCPWPFWNDKCYRTVKSAYPDIALVRAGEHHHALDDAKSQALHLIEINKVAGAVFL